MKALAVLVACTFAFVARSEAAGFGASIARPGVRAPLAKSSHGVVRERADDLLNTTVLGVYPPAVADEASAPEGLGPEYVEREPGPWCAPEPPHRRTARAPVGPRIIYVGKPPGPARKAIDIIYGVN